MRRPTAGLLASFDLLFVLLFVVVVGTPLGAVALLFDYVGRHLPFWLNAGLLPAYGLLVLFGMTVVVRFVRLFLPRVEAGTFKMPSSPKARAWFLHFALQRILYLPLWRPLYFSIAALRTAALRALGARVPMAISTASDPQLLDPALLTIGKGAVIGAGVMTTCHFMLANRLRLAEVRIGADAQLHESAKIALGVTIGEGAVIGPESFIGPDCQIGAGARIGGGCRFVGTAEIGERAKIGVLVVVEQGVKIGAGARVAAGTTVPKGTIVEARGRYPAAAQDEDEDDDEGEEVAGALRSGSTI